MGKRKLREISGMSKEERIKNRIANPKGCLNNTEDSLRIQKFENKQRKFFRHIMKHVRLG
jgi:hypothetical protein